MGAVQPLFLKAIETAMERSRAIDLDNLIEHVRNAVPSEVASEETIEARRKWLSRQAPSRLSGLAPDALLERIISGNELQDINYLEKGVKAAQAVCRLRVRDPDGRYSWGTGFLIAPGILITNNHVLPSVDWAVGSEAHFKYERDLSGRPQDPIVFRFAPQELFTTHDLLDFTIVKVEESSVDGGTQLSSFGYLPLDGRAGKVAEGEWLTIVQHPAGELKQICVRENQLLKRAEDVLWYSTDTLAGSSGSPVFSNDWVVVALHHSGVPERQDGQIQTIDGQVFDPRKHTERDVKWYANEGIRVSRIVQTLQDQVATIPNLRPILTAGAPESILQPLKSPKVLAQETPMSQTVTVRLEINDLGEVKLVNSAQESAALFEATKKKGTRDELDNLIEAPADASFTAAWLKGYDPAFLGNGVKVLLPKLPSDATPATHVNNSELFELKYENFSIIQNGARRLAYVSAANIDGGQRFRLSGRDDNWLLDPRIRADQQLGPTYYQRNKLDRGHLTRREDLEFGGTVQASVRSANGTNVYTNCAPQHAKFNQGRKEGIGQANDLWLALEQYLLEQTAVSKALKICVFTGPVFDETDPVYRGFKIPLDYWKVVIGLTKDEKLFATAYLLSQEGVIDVTKLDESTDTVPFGQFKTYQVKVALISQMTGLSFTCNVDGKKDVFLDVYDPLANPVARTKLRHKRLKNSGNLESAGADETALGTLSDIILP